MNEYRKERIILIIENIFIYLQKNVFPFVPQTIGFLFFLYLFPIFCLLMAPLIEGILKFATLNPSYIINDEISYIGGGILLGAFIFPYFSMCNIRLDEIGMPRYTFNFWKLLFGLFISPLIIGALINFFMPELTISDLFSFIVNKSTYITEYIQQSINVDDSFYFEVLTKVIPIAMLTIIALKYLLYWFIMLFINFIIANFKLLMIINSLPDTFY